MRLLRIWIAVIATFGAGSVAAEGLKDTITFRSGDGYYLEATLGVPTEVDSLVAGVVLVHSGGATRAEWDRMFDRLLEEGYLVLSYDIRGHGKSTALPDGYPRQKLYDDPEMAPRDLATAVKVLSGLDMVDGRRVAVVGSSIGANLACVAVAKYDVKTAVALSPKTSAVRNLAGQDSLSLKSVYYLSSEGDGEGKRETWAKELYEMTAEPRQIEIIEGSKAHGTGILKDDPKTEDRILAWLKETL